MTWQAYSVDTLTGVVQDRIPVSGFTWDRALSAGRSLTCMIPLDGLDYSLSDLRDLTQHWVRTIVLEHEGAVVAAGLIRARSYQDRVLTLQLVDLWGLWGRRGAWDHNHPTMVEWSVTYTSTTLGTLAKRAVQRGTTGPPIPDMDLPITLPSDVSGSLSRTYYGYHYEVVADVLDDLMAEGLNIDFRPRWVDGALDWEMRNDPAEYSWEWHLGAPAGGVTGFKELSDGARMTNNSRVLGEGSERAMVAQSQRNLSSTLPLLDRIEARKYVTSNTQASALAGKALTQYEFPTASWSFDVLAAGTPDAGVPAVGGLRLGDNVRLWFDGDPWITDGYHDRQIVRLDGSLGEKVTVTLQPTGGL